VSGRLLRGSTCTAPDPPAAAGAVGAWLEWWNAAKGTLIDRGKLVGGFPETGDGRAWGPPRGTRRARHGRGSMDVSALTSSARGLPPSYRGAKAAPGGRSSLVLYGWGNAEVAVKFAGQACAWSAYPRSSASAQSRRLPRPLRSAASSSRAGGSPTGATATYSENSPLQPPAPDDEGLRQRGQTRRSQDGADRSTLARQPARRPDPALRRTNRAKPFRAATMAASRRRATSRRARLVRRRANK